MNDFSQYSNRLQFHFWSIFCGQADRPLVDIDGMLFEFFMNILNIEKKKIKNFVCNISCFLRVSCYFQH